MTEETNISRDWSVAAAADFTPQRLKPRVRKNTAFVLREQTAYLGRKKSWTYSSHMHILMSSKKCVYNPESHLQPKFI